MDLRERLEPRGQDGRVGPSVRVRSASAFLTVCLVLAASTTRAGEGSSPPWRVLRGDADGWSFSEARMSLRQAQEREQWLVSAEPVGGHWTLDAVLRSSDPGATRGVLFSLERDLSQGYLLAIEGHTLTFSRVLPPAVGAIVEDFSGDLARWRIGTGRPEIRGGALVLSDDAAEGGNVDLVSREYVALNQSTRARVRIRALDGTGGYQVSLTMTDGRNSVRLQRRAGNFGSSVNLTVTDGDRSWTSPHARGRGAAFDLELAYDRETGIFTGFHTTEGGGRVPVADTRRSTVSFATWSSIGEPQTDGGTVRLPPGTPVRVAVNAFGTTRYHMEVESVVLGPDEAASSSPEPVAIDYTPEIGSWKLPPASSDARRITVAKRGGGYEFRVDGAIIETVTNPRATSMSDLATLLDTPEPDAGHYGFFFRGPGTHEALDIRLRTVQLAKKFDGNPVLPSRGPRGAWDDAMIHTACARKFGDMFYIYYTGRTGAHGGHAHSEGGRIGVAVSHDGYAFERHEGNPVFDRIDPNAEEALGNVQGGAVTRLADGRFALTYTVHNGARWHQLEYALGADPLGPFEGKPAAVLLRAEPRDAFDGEHIHLHDIQRENDRYVMLYTGFSIARAQIPRAGDKGGLATSADFTSWRKDPRNPVFPLGEPGAWDDGHVRPKGFIRHGDYCYMFYEGAHKSHVLPYFFDQVGLARSRDLVTWERFPDNPVISIDAGGGRDTIVTEWPSPVATDDGLAVFYWGGSPGQVAISRADISWDVLQRWGHP